MRPDGEHFEERDGASLNPTSVTEEQQLPGGTIPIVRVQRHCLLNAPSIQNYGRKQLNGVKRQVYGGLLATGDDILGAKAIINLWNPSVQQDSEYSSAKIWLAQERANDRSNNVEAGWMVILFVDLHMGFPAGCFSLLCPGFVQTSDRIALGAAFTNVSTAGRKPI
ncbi:unnamed protein product [Musa textilis]